MFQRTFLAIAALGLAFGQAACSDVSEGSAQGAVGNDGPIILQSPTPGEQLLQKMQRAATGVAYSGVRRVEQTWRVGEETISTSYREEVASDGEGRFALRSLELIAPSLPEPSEELWRMLQGSREGFLFRYRDFRIHDVASMVTNYSPILLGTNVHVAGRVCDEMMFALRHGASFTYNLAVDRETGLVMRCEQVATDGQVMGLVEFESIELNPSFAADFEWHVPSNDEQPLPDGQASRLAVAGFVPLQPQSDGGRFALVESTVLRSEDPAGGGEVAWVKSTLTDGVEVVFVLHGGSDPSLTSEDVMRVAPSVGPWNHVEGTLRQQRFMALGRASVDELLDLIASTL